MTPVTNLDLDRENLSALFDGELEDDAARFALKRLGHDAGWRGTCGRWQLAGDALRGQVLAIAPQGFAARVAAAVTHEARVEPRVDVIPAVRTDAVAAQPAARRRWMGGAALAASVAVAALFVVRPFSNPAAPDASTEVAIPMATAPSSAGDVDAGAAAPASGTPGAGVVVAGAAAVAVADVPRRASDRRSRGQRQRAVPRAASRQAEASVQVASATTLRSGGNPAATAVATQGSHVPSVTTDPFRPQGEIVSRPWPRAVLPNAPATGAFAASYGSAGPKPPSFYPFEPRMPQTSQPASTSSTAPQP